jgi:hypothetical protein
MRDDAAGVEAPGRQGLSETIPEPVNAWCWDQERRSNEQRFVGGTPKVI